MLGWLGAAWLVVAGTTRQSEQVDDLVGAPLQRRGEARAVAGQRLLRALLRPDVAGLPDHYELRLFLPDEQGLLVPEFESAGSTPSDGWEPGQGATGMAWQQERYAHLAIVASNAVQNARGAALGVLSVSSEVDDGHFDTPEAKLDLLSLCEVVGRVLIDVRRIGRD